MHDQENTVTRQYLNVKDLDKAVTVAKEAGCKSAIESMEIDEVSEPVQTQFGFHVIKLKEIRDAPPPPLQQVQREIVELLTAQITESVVQALEDSGDISVVEGQPGLSDISNLSLITDEE